MKQASNDFKTLFLSGAVVAGESLEELIGGDPTALQKTKDLLDRHLLEVQKNKPLKMTEIYIEGDPEKTMQNITRYLYQELGDQMIRVPAYVIAGKLKTMAEMTGASMAYMTSKIHADIRKATGESRIGESVMYAIPLSLMSAMNWPLKDAIRFKGAKETMDYVASMLSSAAVHTVRDIHAEMVLRKYSNAEISKERR